MQAIQRTKNGPSSLHLCRGNLAEALIATAAAWVMIASVKLIMRRLAQG